MERFGALKLDIYVAVILALVPLGWSISGFPPNVVLSCLFWGAALVLLIHAFWIYERTSTLRRRTKLFVTVAAVSLVVSTAWSPVVTEYRKEHTPTFLLIAPGVWLTGPVPQWYFLVQHRGPENAFHVQIIFQDLDRTEKTRRQPVATPEGIRQEVQQFEFPEIDAGPGFGVPPHFLWSPLDPDHEHFSAVIGHRGGRVSQDLRIEHIGGKWQYALRVETPQHKKLYECRDPNFPSTIREYADVRRPCFPDVVHSE
jgi:hypothetical protein